ncbi:hypothetical protein BBOR36S_03442 [Brevibacillus borstelensis]|jgi:hypothetical protein
MCNRSRHGSPFGEPFIADVQIGTYLLNEGLVTMVPLSYKN